MTHLMFLSIALWIWVVSAVGAMVFLIWLWSSEDVDSPKGLAAILAFLVAASGLLFCSLELLGFPLVALWSWRVLSGAVAITCPIVLAWLVVHERRSSYSLSEGAQYRRPPDTLGRLLMIGTMLLAMAVFACAIGATAPEAGTPALVPATVRQALTHTVADSLVRMDFWHAASLVTFGGGTLLFGLLFILALQRSGLLWLESSSGGLGGGVGGWRVSSSAGYLAAAIVFGVMFGTLIVHDENLSRGSPQPAGSSAPAAGNATSPTLPTAPKTEPTEKAQSPVSPTSAPAAKQP